MKTEATTTTLEPVSVNQTEAARLLGVSEKTLQQWDKAGILTGTKIGGLKLYAYSKLKQLVEGHS